MIRQLLSYIPANNMEDPPRHESDDPPDRADESLDSLIPDENASTSTVNVDDAASDAAFQVADMSVLLTNVPVLGELELPGLIPCELDDAPVASFPVQ